MVTQLKDATGQIRCAMFKRAASLLDFSPKDGELVELRGRLGVYEARGDLQLVVESMRRAGQGHGIVLITPGDDPAVECSAKHAAESGGALLLTIHAGEVMGC